MEENSTAPFDEFQYPTNFQIPLDLFVSKKREGLPTGGFLQFTDSTGNLVYSLQRSTTNSDDHNSTRTKLLLDSSGNTLVSIVRIKKGSWQGFKGNIEEKHLWFVVEKTIDEFSRTEFKILLSNDNNADLKTEIQMKGRPFKRACTIYRGDSIVAETSLMNKLGIAKHFVPRNRFRVTIFPGFSDHSVVASFVAIYFDGRKLWI